MCSLKMGGIKDPTIKLFGKTIQLHFDSNGDSVVTSKIGRSGADTDDDAGYGCSDQNILCSKQSENRGDEKSSTNESINSKTEEEQSSSSDLEECKTPQTESPKTPSKKDDPSDQSSSTQNPPKKPDKILPCPRCNSMNTKFCYFNNYNVNQPRHFCKNCQRYWTAGGTMRNVPVGAGRRKNKNSSHHQTLSIPSPHNPLICHQAMRTDGSLLAFGPNSNSPVICENIGSRFSTSLYTTQPNWVPKTWDLQWVSTTPQSYLDQTSSTTSSNSCSLGKRAWDGTLLRVSSSNNNNEKLENVSQRFAKPKTLRIDDPNDAAKSSIWGALGLKKLDHGCSSKGGSFFQGFHQSKDDIDGGIDDDRSDPNMVLQANPAAFSRSLAFHESPSQVVRHN